MKFKNKEKIYFIYPYYENPLMLEKQIDNWNNYTGELRDLVEIILVDDCSPENPAAPIMERCKLKKSVYRVLENIPWGQHHARNVGASVVKDENAWLFMSDIDIIFTPQEFCNLMDIRLNPNRLHTFERKFLNGDPPKYHLNTFLVKHRHFWGVNGYDVDFCGTYGGDGPFLQQLNIRAPQLHHGTQSDHLKPKTELSGHIVTLWGCNLDDVPDANTREWTRKEGEFRDKYLKILEAKKASGDTRSKNPLRWPFEKVL